jgi:hypothetical protein
VFFAQNVLSQADVVLLFGVWESSYRELVLCESLAGFLFSFLLKKFVLHFCHLEFDFFPEDEKYITMAIFFIL